MEKAVVQNVPHQDGTYSMGAQWLQRKAKTRATVPPLGVDRGVFQPGAIDHDRWIYYSFVGSNWGGKREIFDVDVANITRSCAFYGAAEGDLQFATLYERSD